jgi:hypothetical protein
MRDTVPVRTETALKAVADPDMFKFVWNELLPPECTTFQLICVTQLCMDG